MGVPLRATRPVEASAAPAPTIHPFAPWVAAVIVILALAVAARWQSAAAYRAGYDAGQREADQDAVYSALIAAVHGSVRAAIQQDSLVREEASLRALVHRLRAAPAPPPSPAPTVAPHTP